MRVSLAEAVLWCETNASLERPGQCLRQLPCPVDVGRLGLLGLGPRNLVGVVDGDRVRALRARKLNARWTGRDSISGRFLVYFPEDDTADGGAESLSGGYFDVHNCPPWDSWVGFFDEVLMSGGEAIGRRGYLLAYVPSCLVALAARGVEANPERCICWLEDAGVTVGALLAGEEG